MQCWIFWPAGRKSLQLTRFRRKSGVLANCWSKCSAFTWCIPTPWPYTSTSKQQMSTRKCHFMQVTLPKSTLILKIFVRDEFRIFRMFTKFTHRDNFTSDVSQNLWNFIAGLQCTVQRFQLWKLVAYEMPNSSIYDVYLLVYISRITV